MAPQLDGAKALVVAPSGPLLSLPFEVLLTGPAQPTDLRDAPWLVRQFTLAHVPAPSNFVSLRKIATGSRATKPWFGFGDFRPVTLAQAQRSFPGATCADSAQLLSGLPLLPYAGKELSAARDLLGASPSDELLGPAFTAEAVLKTPLKNYRILHFATHALLPTDLRCQSEPAIVTSDPPGAPDATGALLTASRSGGAGSGRRPGDPVGVQLGRARRNDGGRKPVRVGARVLLCRRAFAAGDALVGERPGGGVPGGGYVAAHEGESGAGRGGRVAQRTARDAGRCRQGIAGGNRPSVLLGAVRGDRRRWRTRDECRSGFKIPAGGAMIGLADKADWPLAS